MTTASSKAAPSSKHATKSLGKKKVKKPVHASRSVQAAKGHIKVQKAFLATGAMIFAFGVGAFGAGMTFSSTSLSFAGIVAVALGLSDMLRYGKRKRQALAILSHTQKRS